MFIYLFYRATGTVRDRVENQEESQAILVK